MIVKKLNHQSYRADKKELFYDSKKQIIVD